MQNFNRLPIINDTTRSVYPASMADVWGDDENDQPMQGWTISISCPVNGMDTHGYFDTRDEAMTAIRNGEY